MKDPLTEVIAAIQDWSGVVVPPYRFDLVKSELVRLGDGKVELGAARALRGDSSARRMLLSAVTIPETYFFRHPEHFQALTEFAKKRAAESRPCHVLSAGASTGEEAWSAAAVLATIYGRSAIAHSVTGIELDPSRVRQAITGVYSKWSARQGFLGHEALFVAADGRYRVHDSLRPVVRFFQGNLGEYTFPPEARFDVIFFRNVAIYWPEERSRQVVSVLANHLAADGLFILGPSDPRVYSQKPPSPPPPLPSSSPAGSQAPAPVKVHAVDPPEPAAPGLAQVEIEANAGNYSRVLEMVRSAPGERAPATMLWEAIALINLDRFGEAVSALRQCVFLLPEEPLYRRWLAVALEASGLSSAAAREHRNARELEDA